MTSPFCVLGVLGVPGVLANKGKIAGKGTDFINIKYRENQVFGETLSFPDYHFQDDKQPYFSFLFLLFLLFLVALFFPLFHYIPLSFSPSFT